MPADPTRFATAIDDLIDDDADITVLAAIMVGTMEPRLARMIRDTWGDDDFGRILNRAARIRAMLRLFRPAPAPIATSWGGADPDL